MSFSITNTVVMAGNKQSNKKYNFFMLLFWLTFGRQIQTSKIQNITLTNARIWKKAITIKAIKDKRKLRKNKSLWAKGYFIGLGRRISFISPPVWPQNLYKDKKVRTVFLVVIFGTRYQIIDFQYIWLSLWTLRQQER